ncbi:MAG: type II toxin-antitoxin system VapB family antitoxin [Acidobacteria bacterium]|nr:type II toxin-antitoxin system VapB family antitoxin [Acidobacteriota bacterium]
MPISIKSEQTERVARQLVELTGETLTEAIRAAVVERYDRLNRTRSHLRLADELNAIALRCARRPVISTLTDEEFLGYDDLGVPTR